LVAVLAVVVVVVVVQEIKYANYNFKHARTHIRPNSKAPLHKVCSSVI